MINRLITAVPVLGNTPQAQGKATSLPADFARMLDVIEPDPLQPLNPGSGQGAPQGNSSRQDREPILPMPNEPLLIAINAVDANPAASVTVCVEIPGHGTLLQPIATAYVSDQLPFTRVDVVPHHSLTEALIPDERLVPVSTASAPTQTVTHPGSSLATVHHNSLHPSDADLVQHHALPRRIGHAQPSAVPSATVPQRQLLAEPLALPESVPPVLFEFPDLPIPGLVLTHHSAVQAPASNTQPVAQTSTNAQMPGIAIHSPAFQSEATTAENPAAQAQEVVSTDLTAIFPLVRTEIESATPQGHHEQPLHGPVLRTVQSLAEAAKPMAALNETRPTHAPVPMVPIRDLSSNSQPDSQLMAAPSAKSDRTVASSDRTVEWVSLPWRLQANAALSYRGYGDQSMASSRAGLHLETIKAAVTAMARPTPINFSGFEPMLPAVHRYSAFQASLPGKVVSHSASEVDAAAHAEPAFLGHVMPLLMWPQRLLRWRSDGDGATAWVRDYQIDTANAAMLVDSLCCLAQQQGVSLRRVMLNGHELWRSAP